MASVKPSDRITCPHCQGSLKAPPLPPGSLCTCPKCGQSFPIGVAAKESRPAPAAASPTPAPAPASAKPAPVAPAQPKSPSKPVVAEAPVRAELADPRPAPAAPVKSPPPAPVITAAADDVIGQMLLGGATPAAAASAAPPPAPAIAPTPAPKVASPPAAASPKSPTSATRSAAAQPATQPAAAAADPDQDRRLRDLLSVPAAAKSAAAPEHLATSSTQPAHQQTPPPPKPAAPARPKYPDIPVVCKLCGTRMYARPEQVGMLMRCPDCHTDNEVIGPKVKAVKAPAPVSLDGGEDFTLADVGARPAYRPMVEPRGEYRALENFDSSARPNRPAQPAHPRPVTTDTVMTVPAAAATDEDDGGEIVISEPVERIDIKEVVKLPPPDDPDEDNQYRGRFRDDEWGFPADPKQNEAWKKSPFYYGILGFLFYPQTLFRLVFYSLVMSVDLVMLLGAVYCALQGETPLLFGALGLTVSGALLSTFMLGGAFPCLAAIAQDTANGCDEVQNWPDWNIVEWMLQALLVPAAAFLAALPGAVVASGLVAIGREALYGVPFVILVSELMLFPIIFGSMLAEGSFMPISGTIFQSMQRRGDGWLLFYVASVLVGMLLTAAISLVEFSIQMGTLMAMILAAPVAAVLWVTTIILYFRLLGRLLWYAHNYRRQRDRPE